METIKFDLSEIDKTFTNYKKNEIFDGVVILKREDGVVFNIGGKSDAFIEKQDFENLKEKISPAILNIKYILFLKTLVQYVFSCDIV